ncbi:MAG: tRNA pseudouridine(55) synthase TruB [Christensenellaceae bacterium]|nr:tRNA pseudouridine(55) synthase TruB [Christensenellaceae bacterium]
MAFEGIVSVLKPPGMTSSDVVVDVRRIFGEKRVGHTGTLDPAAAGVLPICIGRATRLFDYLVDKKKEYLAEIRFGASTDTGDAYGVVTETKECSVTHEQLVSVLPEFIGEIEQIPPIYSSISMNGVKLYKLARRGEVTAPIEERKRRITIHALECVEKLAENSFLIRISCSKGTYIRTLCMDIGRRLKVPAYMPFLLRTESGRFKLDDAHTIAELRELGEAGMLDTVVVPMDEAVENIPALRLDGLSARHRRLLVNGAPIPCGLDSIAEGEVKRIYADGDFLGLGTLGSEGLHITVWLGKEDLQK